MMTVLEQFEAPWSPLYSPVSLNPSTHTADTYAHGKVLARTSPALIRSASSRVMR